MSESTNGVKLKSGVRVALEMKEEHSIDMKTRERIWNQVGR